MSAADSLYCLIDPEEILSEYDSTGKIEDYLRLLRRENQKVNLVSRETSTADLRRLAAESLLPFKKLNLVSFRNYLDIGSGGGLPAIPIMIAIRPAKVTLLERTQKKAGALRRMLLDLKLEARVINQNLEESNLSETYDLVTVRLVKLSPQLLKSIGSLLSSEGVLIYFAEIEKEAAAGIPCKSYSYKVNGKKPVKTFTLLGNLERFKLS